MSIEKGCVLDFLGETLELLPQKALLWHERKLLVVADVHFGKVGHFRKAGIAIPKSLEQEDLATLSDLIVEHKPKKVIFLGDLFHSEMNNDWHWIELWRDLFPDIDMILVLGNHDILMDTSYKKAKFEVVDELQLEPFIFTHEPIKDPGATSPLYNISGHIHPAVKLRGKGRQRATLPCFYFADKMALLPAFGQFTGTFIMDFKQSDRVYGVLDTKVVPLI